MQEVAVVAERWTARNRTAAKATERHQKEELRETGLMVPSPTEDQVDCI